MKQYRVKDTGKLIVGVRERLFATAHISGLGEPDEGSRPSVVYTGQSDVDWDTQHSVVDGAGGRTFVCEDNFTHPESDLEVFDDGEEEAS